MSRSMVPSSVRLAALALAVIGSPVMAASQSTDSVSVTEGDAYREFGYIPMHDGVKLAYVVWLPKKAGRFPAVFHYGPYSSGGTPFAQAKRFLEAGYAFVGANMRGTGCSEGIDTEAGGVRAHTMGRDGAAVVEWVAKQKWSTGNVGMVGNSYVGGSQFAVAANNPPHLKAIVASGIAMSDYHECYHAGGLTHLGGLAAWTLSIQGNEARAGLESRLSSGDQACEVLLANRKPLTAYSDAKQHPLFDEWWEERSLAALADRIQVPTMIQMGWHDEWNLNGATPLFAKLKTQHKKIVLQNGGHGVGSLEKRGYQMDHEYGMRWLDRWVKGIENGVDKEQPVTVFWEVRNAPVLDGTNAIPGWKTTYAAWPAPQTNWVTFHLTADGKLSADGPAASNDDGVRQYLYPTGTELVGSNEQFALVPYQLGTLSYRTEPMGEDMTILGQPKLSFSFSSEQKDTDFMFTLKDVDPQGNTLYLQRAFLRASMRAVDQQKSTPDVIVQSFRKIEELVPGETYKVEVSITAIGHVVRKGHRLELSILAPSPIPTPVMGGLPVALPSVNKVYHSPKYPATLLVPVIPGEKAQNSPPECGSLQFQPCRRATPAT